MDDVVVDASVFVSRLFEHDVHHDPSARWFEDREREGGLFVVPAILPAEVAGAVRRRLDDGSVARRIVVWLMRLPALRVVTLDRRVGEQIAQLAADLGLRGADASYVAVARMLGLPLVTWDQDQSRRAEGTVATLTPSA